MNSHILVATSNEVLCVDPGGQVMAADGLGDERPACIATAGDERAWCGTRHGVFRSDDGGRCWTRSGLEHERVTAISVSPVRRTRVWAGTEPSAMWRSDDAGHRWEALPAMQALPSAPEWSFPPRPETHHVRWIACHPARADQVWVAIEAGALVSAYNAGQGWRDRVPGGPYDTHELAVHAHIPDTLRSAAGDGYFESRDGGATWTSPMDGLDVSYLRSVAIDPGDPEVVIVSAATGPYTAYSAGSSDGRLYRRERDSRWTRITSGWPDPPATIAPLLAAGRSPGELWAVDERGVHRSDDGGLNWTRAASFKRTPRYVMGLAVV